MVATRRQAPIVQQGDVIEEDPEVILRKKPVRKPAAKAQTKVEATGRAIRSKAMETKKSLMSVRVPATRRQRTRKMEVEAEDELQGSDASEADEIAVNPVGRPRKIAEVSNVSANKAAVPEKESTRSAAAGSVRRRKATAATKESAVVDEVAAKSIGVASNRAKEGLDTAATLDKPKPSRQIRGSAPKPQPLSPKKITQVNSAQTRGTRRGAQKPAARTAVAKLPTASNRTARQRAVSEENAEVSEFGDATDEEGEAIILSSTPKAKRNVRETKRETAASVTKEMPMSSRSITLGNSPAQTLSRIEVEEETAEGQNPASSEADLNLEDETGVSEDELCGPKTPVKRSTPGPKVLQQLTARRTNGTTRKGINAASHETAASRFAALLSTKRMTAYTRNPESMPASANVRVSVVRSPASTAAFKSTNRSKTAAEHDDSFVNNDIEDSFLPDAEIVPAEVVPTSPEATYLSYSLQSPVGPEDDDESPAIVGDESLDQRAINPAATQHVIDDFEETIVVISDDDSDGGSTEDNNGDTEVDAAALVQNQDDDLDEHVYSALDTGSSFDTEDTVIIHHTESCEFLGASAHEVDTIENSVVTGGSLVSAANPIKDTDTTMLHAAILVNFDEHLNQLQGQAQGADLTIPMNFDLHMTDLRQPLSGSVELDEGVSFNQEYDAELGAGLEPNASVVYGHSSRDIAEGKGFLELTQVSSTAGKNDTIDLNEFLDVAALTEPTMQMDLAPVESSEPQVAQQSAAAYPDRFDTVAEVESQDISTPAAPVSPEAHDESTLDDEPLASTPEIASTEPNPATNESNDNSEEPQVPHYALPTIAFDARRKSLPAFDRETPAKADARPHTSDGASMPRVAVPFGTAWWTRSRGNSATATPVRATTSIAEAVNVPASTIHSARTTLTPVDTPSAPATPKERYPALPSRKMYGGQTNTVAAPVRFQTPKRNFPARRQTFHKAMHGNGSSDNTLKQVTKTQTAEPITRPIATPVATPQERYPRRRPRGDYEAMGKTVGAPVRFQTPSERSPKRRETFHKAISGQTMGKAVQSNTPSQTSTAQTTPNETPQATPQAKGSERFPRLRPRDDYEEHAKTTAAPTRFRTPISTPVKRPATIEKPDALRKAISQSSASRASNTPVKTPLKAPGTTPSHAPMTPHPAAPLRGVLVLVEVFTLEGSSASAPFVALLHRLGAKTTKTWTDRITHVVFKDGSPTTLQRVRLHNKEVKTTGKGTSVHCVNSRWVTDCDAEGARMDEALEAYAVDVAEVPRGGKRRRKSMEPAALLNLGGNIVRDRKSSVGRASLLSRLPLKAGSPNKRPEIEDVTPKVSMTSVDKENSGDEMGSPATPVWIAAPEQLVQMTAPMNRVRKLELQGGVAAAKNRRLTFWNGGA